MKAFSCRILEKLILLFRELRLRAGMFNDHMPWGYQVTLLNIHFDHSSQYSGYFIINPSKCKEPKCLSRLFDVFQGLFKGLKGDDGNIGLTDLIKYL